MSENMSGEEIAAKAKKLHKSKAWVAKAMAEDEVHTSLNIPREVWEGFAVRVMREHGPRNKNIVIRQLMEQYIEQGIQPEWLKKRNSVVMSGREHYNKLAKERIDDAKIKDEFKALDKELAK